MKILNRVQKFVRDFFSHFTNQIIAIFIITIAAVISLTVFLFYNSTTEIIKKDAIGSNEIVLNQINKNFAEYVKTMQNFALNLRTDEKLLSILKTGDTNYSDHEYISSYIKTMFYSRQDISNISLYILANQKNFTFSKANRKIVVNDSGKIANEIWFQQVVKNRYYAYVTPQFQSNSTSEVGITKDKFFTIYRAIINVYTKETIAVVAVTCDDSMLEDIVNDVHNDENSMVCLMDSNSRIYYVNDRKLLQPEVNGEIMRYLANSKKGSSNFPITIQGEKYLAVYNISETNQWQIVKLLSVKALNEKSVQSRNASLLILVAAIAFSTMIIMVIIHALTSSLTALSKQMRLAGDGDLKTTVDEKGSYEIVILAHRYNSMIHKIDDLIQKNYISEINEKTASLRALEAQVNPHFLYNSLQVISTKAIMSNQNGIYQMIEALAFNLRYSLTEEGIVTVEQEVKHVNNYLLLLKARFEERLLVTIDMADDTKNIRIPKISIYTLVENSAEHGLENMVGQLSIKISIVQRENQLIVVVSDNGPGIQPERLEEIRKWLSEDYSSISSRKHIGLRNLNARIKILFGSNASLIVQSVPGQNTETTMTLPINSEEGTAHVSGSDC